MSLDLHTTMAQLEAVASRLHGDGEARAIRLQQTVATLKSAEADAINQRAQEAQGRFFFPHAELLEAPGARHSAPADPPSDFCILSVDGSHIDVDRHLPVRCSVISIGGSQLVYGSNPDAYLFHQPYLYAGDEGLHLTDPNSQLNAQLLEGPLLGLKRTVEEMRALADLVEETPQGLPILALVDGSLILWPLGGEGPPPGRYPAFVRKSLLEEGFLPAMERIRGESDRRSVAVAGYISLPGSSEVANALRLALCDYDPLADCARHCTMVPRGQRHCDAVHELTDRELFAQLLGPGERSALFASRASVVQDFYGSHAVRFFYLNVGEEIARVEVPAWVAQEPALVDLTHALTLDQCRRGQGYPVALQEAHEQAVISGADREEFRQMVELALEGHRLPVYTSEKQRSKRRRWV